MKFLGVIFLLIGIVWLIEYYASLDLPIVAIALVVIGLYMVFKPCCGIKDKKK